MWQELVGMRHGVKGDFNTGFQDICGNILRILRICSAHAVKGVNIQHRYCLRFGYLTALTVSRDLTPCNINSDASGLPLTHMSKTLPRFCCVLRCANSGPRFLCNGPSQLHDRCGSKPDGVQQNILLLISRFYVDLIHQGVNPHQPRVGIIPEIGSCLLSCLPRFPADVAVYKMVKMIELIESNELSELNYEVQHCNKGQNNPRDIHNSFRESSVCLHTTYVSICQRKSVRPVFSIKIGGIPLMVGWLAADRSLTWPNGMAKMSRVHKCPRMSKCPLLLNNPFV